MQFSQNIFLLSQTLHQAKVKDSPTFPRDFCRLIDKIQKYERFNL